MHIYLYFYFCQSTVFRQRRSSHGALKDFSFSLTDTAETHDAPLFFYQEFFSGGESRSSSHLSSLAAIQLLMFVIFLAAPVAQAA